MPRHDVPGPARSDRGDYPASAESISRLIHRLLSQVERILCVNGLSAVTPAVVDAARESFGDRGPHRRPQAVATTFIAENLTTNDSENDRPAGRDAGR